jgi:hypothetical protein
MHRVNGQRLAIRCSVCGQEGHNKQTCPLSSQGAWGVDAAATTAAASPAAAAAPAAAEVATTTKGTLCSVCGMVGHNKRTCPLRRQGGTTAAAAAASAASAAATAAADTAAVATAVAVAANAAAAIAADRGYSSSRK